MNPAVASSTKSLNIIIDELGFQGSSLYLPPRYFQSPGILKVFVSKQKKSLIPSAEEIQNQGAKIFFEYPAGLLISPPGEELMRLFEEELRIDFSGVDIEFLKENLPGLFIEKLEISKDLRIKTEGAKVRFEIKDCAFDLAGLKPDLEGKIGSPLVSSLACILAKVTGKIVTIEAVTRFEDENVVAVDYRVWNEEELTLP